MILLRASARKLHDFSSSKTHNPGPAALRHVERMYVYYCRTYEKAVSGGGERGKGGHVLRDTTSRGLPLPGLWSASVP